MVFFLKVPRKIEISHRTIIFTVVFLLLIWLLFQIREILFILYVSFLVETILNPTIRKLSNHKIPRSISVILVYLLVLVVIGLTIAGIVPPLVEQTTNFANNLPRYLSNIGLTTFINQDMLTEVVSQIGVIPSQVVKLGVSIFSNLIAVLTVFIFAFYLLMAREKLNSQMGLMFGEVTSKKISKTLDLLETRLGNWARGQLSLMLLIGVTSFVGFVLLGLPYALPLSLLAGIFEIIPNIGPVVAAIPAVIIGFGISPVIGLATVALAFLIQQLENYVFVPKVMEKSVGVSPIFTLIALAIGFKLAGVVGIIVSVPIFITLQVVLPVFLNKD